MTQEMTAPSGLTFSGGIQTIWELAERHNRAGQPQKYRLYVIEVAQSDKFGFYVGSTSRKVETRFEQHASGDKDQNAAKLFHNQGAIAACLRFDLFEGLPYFTERKIAEQAEGVLADAIQTQLKTPVNCNMLNKHVRSRAQAAEKARKITKATKVSKRLS